MILHMDINDFYEEFYEDITKKKFPAVIIVKPITDNFDVMMLIHSIDNILTCQALRGICLDMQEMTPSERFRISHDLHFESAPQVIIYKDNEQIFNR